MSEPGASTYRIGTTEESVARANAINRAKEQRSAWQPVFADVHVDGEKVGHIVSDGYTDEHWKFYPLDKTLHRATARGALRTFEEVLPKWLGSSASLGPYRTMNEIQAESSSHSGVKS